MLCYLYKACEGGVFVGKRKGTGFLGLFDTLNNIEDGAQKETSHEATTTCVYVENRAKNAERYRKFAAESEDDEARRDYMERASRETDKIGEEADKQKLSNAKRRGDSVVKGFVLGLGVGVLLVGRCLFSNHDNINLLGANPDQKRLNS